MSNVAELVRNDDYDDDVRTPLEKLIAVIAKIRKLENTDERRRKAIDEAQQKVDDLRTEMNEMMQPGTLCDVDGIAKMQEKATELKKASEVLTKKTESYDDSTDEYADLILKVKEFANEL